MRKIAVGDLGEFWYGDYKEPFEQLEGGVPGHPVGVVLKADDGKLLCAYCGKTYANLGAHAYWTHKMKTGEYKESVGLLSKSALVSESLRLNSSRTAQRVGFGAYPEHGGSYKGTQRGLGDANGSRKPERLNKTGTCYAQTLAVGRTVLRETGRLSERALRRHGIYSTVIARYFGDMDGYRKAIGMEPVNFQRDWSRDALLTGLRNLALDLGRTPTASDMRRFGLPGRRPYLRVFGSWVEAYRQTGLQPNLPTPDSRDLVVSMFVAYATLGTITKTARHLHINRKRVEQEFARYGAPFTEYADGPGGRYAGTSSTKRREWAAEMARRLAGTADAA